VAGETRQSFTAFEGASGKPYRFILPGPELSANEWRSLQDATIEMAERADLVVASGSLAPGMPEDFYARLAEAMRASGDRLVLDSSGPGLATTLERTPVYLIKPNMHEITELAGKELVWPEGQADWASALIARGRSEIVVVTRGAEGALLVTREQRTRIRPPAIAVVSAVGAGDSFIGGLCAGLVGGQGTVEAGVLGMAAAAATLLTSGTQLCDPAEVERLRAEIEVFDI
jgi:6-phosphofructokinase 2